MNKNLLIFTLLTLFFGCAKGVKTKAVFNLKSINNLDPTVQAISENGMVIFGFNDKGHRFSKVMGTGDDFNHELDNGVWTFKAIAWDEIPGITEKFTGIPNCAVTNITLNGSDTSINLPLNNATCADEAFGGATKSYTDTGKIYFHPLKDIKTCNENISFTAGLAFGDTCRYNMIGHVSETPNSKDRGYFSSYKIIARSFYAGPNDPIIGNTSLESICIESPDGLAASTGGTTVINYQIPSGPGLEFTVQAFYEPGCGNPLLGAFKTFTLASGLNTSSVNIASTNDGTAMSEAQELYLKSTSLDVCNGQNNGPNSAFSGGDGSDGNPYLICNERQFAEIYNLYNAAGIDLSFRLLKDLDMNKETEVFYANTFFEDNSIDIRDGRNHKPIGFSEANKTNASCPVPVAYKGNFDGNDKTIKNLRINPFEANLPTSPATCVYTGLFAQLNAAIVSDLNFENVEIEDSIRNSGIIAGYTQSSKIYNIKVKKGKVRSQSTGGVGGLVGHNSFTSIKKVSMKEVEVITDFDTATIYLGVGGIAGKSDGSSVLQDLVFDGIVEARSNDNNNMYEAIHVGGIVGDFGGAGTTLNRASFTGVVNGDRFLGGIAGRVVTLATASDFFVNGYINSYLSQNCGIANIGGVFGNAFSITSLSNTLFLGKMKYTSNACNIGVVGKVGSIAGELGATGTNSYSVYFQSSSISPGYSGDLATDQEVRQDTYGFYSAAGAINWSHSSGAYPRLKINEDHPCLDNINNGPVSVQVGSPNFRGTQSNPVIICSSAQLQSINDYLSLHFKLADTITLDASEFMTGIVSNNFSGVIDGNNKSILGASQNIMNYNAGVIKNLSFFGVDLNNEYLIDSNNGILQNIVVDGKAFSTGNVSLFVGQNLSNGLIRGGGVFGDVKSLNNAVPANLALVAASNQGTITKMNVYGRLEAEAYDNNASGLVAGFNTGNISLIKAGGGFSIGAANISANQYAGTIAGNNGSSGVISDVEIERFNGYDMGGTLTTQMGFVAGINTGTIRKVLAFYDTQDDVTRVVGTEPMNLFDIDEHFIANKSGGCYGTSACGSTVAQLKGTPSPWSIEPFMIETDINPIFLDYYIKSMAGLPLPTNVPKWEYEGTDDIRLFSVD